MAFGRRKDDEEWDGVERRAAAAVLIVDEDTQSSALLAGALGRAGFRTEVAADQYGAIARMRDHLPRCVVLDVRSGGVGANLQALDAIRGHEDRRIASARVVLCAANPRNRSFSFESGADAFLVHPFHIDELVGAVGEVLAVPEADLTRHRRNSLEQRGGHSR